MNFSEVFKQTDQLCKFSPHGAYLASVSGYRLIIRDVKTLQIQHLYSCVDTIQYIEWSPDSEFILCGLIKRDIVQVFSLDQPEWKCKIDEGHTGLTNVHWSPDSRHILTTADFQLRVTVWSLVNKSVSYIKYPKKCVKGMDFSNEGKYLALIERRDFADYLSLFTCDVWKLSKHFKCGSDDADGVLWSPDSRFLAVWESPLQYKIFIYSIDGSLLKSYSAYDSALGIRHVTWSSTSQFLAVASYDQKVRLLNNVTWSPSAEFCHPPTIKDSDVVVYEEQETSLPSVTGDAPLPKSSLFRKSSKYEIKDAPVELKVKDIDTNCASANFGIKEAEFSRDCRYLFSINENMENVVWIWDMEKMKLCTVLIQRSPVLYVQWDPIQSRLAVCTNSSKLYMWSPTGSLSVNVPSESMFSVNQLSWQPHGNTLLLMDKEDFCVCYLKEKKSIKDTDLDSES